MCPPDTSIAADSSPSSKHLYQKEKSHPDWDDFSFWWSKVLNIRTESSDIGYLSTNSHFYAIINMFDNKFRLGRSCPRKDIHMKLKIAICDDEQNQIEYLSGVVSAWASKNRHVVELKTYSSAKSFLFDYSEEKDFDILLLDIEMPGMTGVELAKTVRKENSTVQIVFITGYYEYFSDGFDVSALHYLIKPADERKLLPVLDRAVSNLNYRQRAVLLTSPDGDVKVSLADICYVESENVHVAVHTVSGVYRSRISLAKFAEQLDETFIKVHRSYIVGLKYVKKISRTDITMLNGDLVPISRGMYDEVHAALIKYL